MYAGVLVDREHPDVDQLFYYKIPDEFSSIMAPGCLVKVPFGLGNKELNAWVIKIQDTVKDINENRIKSIKRMVYDFPLIDNDMINLAYYIKDKYFSPTVQALNLMVPGALRSGNKSKNVSYVYLTDKANDEDEIEKLNKDKRCVNQVKLIDELKDTEGLSKVFIINELKYSNSTINSLNKKSFIEIKQQRIYRTLELHKYSEKDILIALNDEQKECLRKIELGLTKKSNNFLLRGVTGSGKTEVYIRAAKKAVNLGKKVIILVPEISLTPQTVARFNKSFGKRIAILHSRLSAGERFDEWSRINDNQVDIVIGARSAVFAPLKNIGLIVVDECHEDSFISDKSPYYDAIDIAKRRLKNKSVLVLGSATPSIEQFYKAQNGEYELLTIDNRVNKQEMPKVIIKDMRQEIKKGNKSVFSKELFDLINEALNDKKQVILLLNRRGFSKFVTCRSCGYIAKCPHCDVTLTYHQKSHKMVCHYCYRKYAYPTICPACESKFIKKFGIGTQQLEEQTKMVFKNARVLRMDSDTTSRKGDHQRLLSMFKNHEYDILLGTQMIAKGLDFANVTLVGVIAADLALNMPEYRTNEKAFQLINQVSGRAGRAENKGNVVVQTYQPANEILSFAKKHDYIGFYEYEIERRKKMINPPFTHIIKIEFTGMNEEETYAKALKLERNINFNISKNERLKSGLVEIGCYPSPISKINDRYRFQILIKIRPEEIVIKRYSKMLQKYKQMLIKQKVDARINFYPLSFM